jgi:enamine deaminase RidA (YjgF/YER057c/UK114 family)
MSFPSRAREGAVIAEFIVTQERTRVQTITAGYHAVTLPGLGPKTYSLTICPDSGGAGDYVEAGRFLREAGAAVLSQRVFTGPGMDAGGIDNLMNGAGRASWPVTTLVGNGSCPAPMTHTCLEAVSGVLVKPIASGGRLVGATYEDGGATVCVLGDLRPRDDSATREEQARCVFAQLEAALDAAGMTPDDLVRTWFFIDRILEWYGQFNSIRSSVFEEWGLFDRVLPASTGVGSANAAGAAVAANAIAIKPAGRPLDMIDVVSPLQCPAMQYRSSFSRAVEVNVGGQRRLYISGTASIAPDGSSAHHGDLDRQIALTMDVVKEILRSRGMGWPDVTRGTAYFRDGGKMSALERYYRRHGLPCLPVAVAAADICRDDLLFEIEVDAAATV